MYDTLWIGCSHSAGLYNNKNVIISPDNGIANRLAASLQEKWKILAIRGEGIHTYMECIKVLDNNGHLNKFKNIIVQQTSEPRLNFYTSKGYQHMFDNILRYIENDDINKTCDPTKLNGNKVFSINANEFHEYQHHHFDKEKINFIDLATEIAESVDPRDDKQKYYAVWTQAALDYIKLISEKNGCKFYTFKWVSSNCNRPATNNTPGLFNENLDIIQMIYKIGLKKYLTNPGLHPTEKILEFAHVALLKELSKVGYK